MEILILLVLAFASLNIALLDNFKFVVICVLCFVKGLQNAIITKISNARMRTTHITGLTTDIGIQIGKFIYRLLSFNKEVLVNYSRLKMHSFLLFFFCLGGFAGALTFKFFGFFFVIILAAILILLFVILSSLNSN